MYGTQYTMNPLTQICTM